MHIDTGEIIYEVEGVKSLLRKGDLVVISNKLHHRGLKTASMRPETRATILYHSKARRSMVCRRG